ncbi:MAG TPA: thiamine-phosphate kinase [Solibacterales bacterium]|nr:thiamine-phosphate kinase [Bryobacterales bacterium]
MNELELVRRLARLQSSGPGVVLGIGDDAAIFRPSGGEDLVFTTDMFIEDVHFRRRTHSAEDAGYKAMARGLSDIAAMGAWPRFCLLSIALAPWAKQRWFEGFVKGVRQFDVPLIGGDLSHSDRVAADIVVCGGVPKGEALSRFGAQPGDTICVSGPLGASALGLRTKSGEAWERHMRPEPRLAMGVTLRGKASAAMDLSDGLSIDLKRLCEASGVAAELDREPPRFPGAKLDDALHGGEDYELLFTLPPKVRRPPRTTAIGRIVEGKPGSVTFLGEPLPARGYQHFR